MLKYMFKCIDKNIFMSYNIHILKHMSEREEYNMARRKIDVSLKKVNTCLTVSRDIKEMYDAVAQEKGMSISELFSNYIEKEYNKLVKAGKKDPIIKGQMNINDI